MNKSLFGLGIILLLIVGWFTFFNPQAVVFAPTDQTERLATTSQDTDNGITAVADNLSVPWGVAFLPDGNMLVTERTGRLLKIDTETGIVASTSISSATAQGEGGLLGVAAHPNFSENKWVYLYETTTAGDGLENRVVRYVYADSQLSEQTVIISGIPGASYHDGGRIAFGPDGYLFVTTGDAGNPQQAQNTDTLNGSILRLNSDGSIPTDNSFGNAVYSYGHRNPQGLAWHTSGQLFSTEHGRSGLRSGLDEVNFIKQGGNYGWPYIEGDETCSNGSKYSPPIPAELSAGNCNLLPPLVHSGPDITWAPASAAYWNGSLFFAGLRGQALYEVPIRVGAELAAGEVISHFKERLGRLRTVVVDPDEEYLYVTTSNTDGRGNPDTDDDKLLRIPLSTFR